ncbi:arylamine N-acetyltransferase [Streptomyces sp. WAC06614]|uniref:arylamine N-acetyltransferase family protein n=1 Tax=Streptomyces sp. WAC06614 TaxID=2487416 RepID=UPI000F7A239A|nr:arylamine N-acetyltransferase [Streptomyces sp. WAC06614]RSS79174.1 arylamine N-acetyltransferase [Streptomyces sp. WAC06614]
MWSGERLELDGYLERIGLGGELRPDLATLRAVQRAHIAAVPFENLDVLLGRPVALDLASIEGKLVRGGRGGYCYEQNSLLAAALERIGFEVAGRGARNRTRGDALLPVTHAVLVVTVDGEPWLVDAGFGANGPTEPVPLRPGAEVTQGAWDFGVAEEPEGVLVLRTRRTPGAPHSPGAADPRVGAGGEPWRDLYAFAPQRLYPVDFVLMNHWSSTHPSSFFTGRLVVMRPGPSRRLALVDRELVRWLPDGAEERSAVVPGELIGLLDREFGIRLPERDAAELVRILPAG